jgi:transcriptional regulator with XRE-family HTH domain
MFSEMIGRPEITQAPPFGRRLAEARREKGLTQPELGKLLGMSRERVDYYERRAKNPALEVVQACAKVLGVPVLQLVGDDEPLPQKKKTGPVSQLERKFQEVKRLPRKKQEFILQFLDTILESNQQKQKA